MSRPGPETKLLAKMAAAAKKKYGERLVIVKNHGSEYARSGVSDVTGVLDGVGFAIEVKSPDSSQHKRKTLEASIAHALEHGPTPKQRVFVLSVLKAGGCAGFAATIEQFMEILEHAAFMAGYNKRERDLGARCGGHNV